MSTDYAKRIFKTLRPGKRPWSGILNMRFAPQERKNPRGFTLLLAVLISSVLVALGSAIFDIVSKEIRLSSSGRESQFAFYSADTGVECALYWDLKQNAFATTSALTEVTCGGGPAVALTRTLTGQGTNSETLVTELTFPIGGVATDDPCAFVRVTRRHYPTRTTVESSGYNTCVATHPLRLERAIRVTY